MILCQMKISFCTYTYKDARLANELLHHSYSWNIKLNERIVVDDGSPDAFTSDLGDVRIIRFNDNKGVGKAKETGISGCSGDVILSMDCDIRIDPNWLNSALPLALEKDTGIVGAPIISDAGEGITASYERAFMDFGYNHDQPDFLTGGLWLMRRETWMKTGGFAGYQGRTHEDHRFCKRVRELGLALRVCPPAARQVRRLHYTDVVRRLGKWLQPNLGSIITGQSQIADLMLLATESMLKRLGWAVEQGKTIFGYIEMLVIINTALCYADILESKNRAEPVSHRALNRVLLETFSGYPRLLALLLKDLPKVRPIHLTRDKSKIASSENSDFPFWKDQFTQSLSALPPALFKYIENNATEILAEDASAQDYSFYSEL